MAVTNAGGVHETELKAQTKHCSDNHEKQFISNSQ